MGKEKQAVKPSIISKLPWYWKLVVGFLVVAVVVWIIMALRFISGRG